MIILWLLSIVVSTWICWKHDHALIGFLLGFFLGPIGCVIALFLRMHWSASASRDEQIELLRKLAQQNEDQTIQGEQNKDEKGKSERIERDPYIRALGLD